MLSVCFHIKQDEDFGPVRYLNVSLAILPRDFSSLKYIKLLFQLVILRQS